MLKSYIDQYNYGDVYIAYYYDILSIYHIQCHSELTRNETATRRESYGVKNLANKNAP